MKIDIVKSVELVGPSTRNQCVKNRNKFKKETNLRRRPKTPRTIIKERQVVPMKEILGEMEDLMLVPLGKIMMMKNIMSVIAHFYCLDGKGIPII